MTKGVIGVYRNGKVELSECPTDVEDETGVIVVFFPKGVGLISDYGMTPEQAAALRASYGRIAEDWDAPEMDIYNDYDAACAALREDNIPNVEEPSQNWFREYVNRLQYLSVSEPRVKELMYFCPCCRYKTLTERGGFEICPVCFWEDDGQDEQDADDVRGGPNQELSLTQARVNFREFGACTRKMLLHVRPPTAEEGGRE